MVCEIGTATVERMVGSPAVSRGAVALVVAGAVELAPLSEPEVGRVGKFMAMVCGPSVGGAET
jgi:hypothetical protein